MKKSILILFILLSAINLSIAQTFEGVVKDAKTNSVLPFVNVGIIGKSIGTVTTSDGHFGITIAQAGDKDSLRLSIIGYQAKTYAVTDIKKDPESLKTISLEPALVKLKEVRILDHKLKPDILGYPDPLPNMGVGFSSNNLGYEVGVLIKTDRSPILIKRVKVTLLSRAGITAQLRLNFYSSKNGLPDKLLNDQNIFLTVNKGDEEISLDVKPYQVYAEGAFIVSFELLQDAAGKRIMFRGKPEGNSFYRGTSQANWEYMKGVSAGITVEVNQ